MLDALLADASVLKHINHRVNNTVLPPLHFSAAYGKVEAVKVMLRHGAATDAVAISSEYGEALSSLLVSVVSGNHTDASIVHTLDALAEHPRTRNLFTEFGEQDTGRIPPRNLAQLSPMTSAIANKRSTVVLDALLRHGASVNAVCKSESVLMVAWYISRHATVAVSCVRDEIVLQ